MQLVAGAESLSRTGEACGLIPPSLTTEQRRLVWYYGIFPNLLFSPHPDYVLIHQLEPLGLGATQVICSLLFSPAAQDRPDFDPTPAIDFWHQTNAQDWEMCERAQQGVASPAYVPGPYSPRENMVAAFDAHYRSLM